MGGRRPLTPGPFCSLDNRLRPRGPLCAPLDARLQRAARATPGPPPARGTAPVSLLSCQNGLQVEKTSSPACAKMMKCTVKLMKAFSGVSGSRADFPDRLRDLRPPRNYVPPGEEPSSSPCRALRAKPCAIGSPLPRAPDLTPATVPPSLTPRVPSRLGVSDF